MSRIYKTQQQAGLSVAVLNTKSNTFDVRDADLVRVYVHGGSGTHALHVVELKTGGQHDDGTDCDDFSFSTPKTLLGLGYVEADVSAAAFVCVEVTTIEANSTVDLLFNSFKNE